MRIISRNNVDFKNLLAGIHVATGKRAADEVDRLDYKVLDDVKYGMCLSSLLGENLTSPAVEAHLHFTVMVLVEEYDLNEVITTGSVLNWAGSTTTARGKLVGLMSGTLNQWRQVVTSGMVKMGTKEVQKFYFDLAVLFKQEGFDFGVDTSPRIGG